MLNKTQAAEVIRRINNAITESVNNLVCIIGKVVTEPKFYKKGIFETTIASIRGSGTYDRIPVKMSSKHEVKKGKRYLMIGEIQSENTKLDQKHHVEIYMWADEIEEVNSKVEDYNSIFLKGNICKKMNMRFTKHKETPICVSILVVNSLKTKRTAYIPIITWHADAYHVEKNKLGDSVLLYGRMQSRNFFKEKTQSMTYEVSVKRLVCDK